MFDLESFLNSQSLDWKRRGDEYSLLCPFHEERTPSFSINANYPHLYHCYACGAKGGIHTFYYHFTHTRLNLGEALDFEFNQTARKRVGEKITRISSALLEGDILEVADCAEASTYLMRRGATSQWIKDFNVKVAKFAMLGSMIIRNRIVIPLYYRGELMGYEARDFLGTQPKKVLYSPGMKANFLFNYDRLDRKKPLIVTEGIMDTLRLWHLQFNVTSTFGSSYTDGRREQMLEFPGVVLFIDNDPAGEKVVTDVGDFLHNQDVQVWVAQSSKVGQDPGDMNYSELQLALQNKKKLLQYHLDRSGWGKPIEDF